jgi:uncharacterized repeat protein (TIGR03803 family)
MKSSMRRHAIAIVVAAGAACCSEARAGSSTPTFSTLVAFGKGAPPGALSIDAAGDIFGTLSQGGTYGDGEVYELPAGNYSDLIPVFSFNGSNGAGPAGRLAFDSAGDLFGRTVTTAYELSGPNHQSLSILATFNTRLSAGTLGLTSDSAGNLYGALSASSTVFELSGAAHGTYTTLYTYSSQAAPNSEITVDAAGNLYGTTAGDGASTSGTVYKLSAPTHQTNSFLTTFSPNAVAPNGADPGGGVALDASGNLYGTTQFGGANNAGSLFELSSSGGREYLTTLASFTASEGHPLDTPVVDAAGDVFASVNGNGTNGAFGQIIELSGPADQTVAVLHAFDDTDDGADAGTLVADSSGDLFGVTDYGGPNGYGTVFELSNAGFAVPEPACMGFFTGAMALCFKRAKSARRWVSRN